MTGTNSAPEGVEVVDEFEGGVGWIAEPAEPIRMASHALVDEGDVWLIDPVDAEGVENLWADHGSVAGVVLLLDRHKRDAARLARRHDVSVWLHDSLASVSTDLDAPVRRYEERLGDTDYRAEPLVTNRFWREVGLWNGDSRTLVVPEAVGTTPFFCSPGERLGVHPVLRPRPPGPLREFEPSRILVGHGAGVHESATAALRTAIEGARRGAPSLYWSILRSASPV